MATMSLVWVGDLNRDKRMCTEVSDDRYHPKLIELKEGQKEIKIGRVNSKSPPNYLIESCMNKHMISRTHATVERLPKGGFMLYDHSMNGTYVNYIRVPGGVSLQHGDVVCFGHLNGANLKPGDGVGPFFSDLKYKVCIDSSEEVAAATNDSNPGRVSASNIQRKTRGNDHKDEWNAIAPPKIPNRNRSGDNFVSSVKSEPKDSDEDVMGRLPKLKSIRQSGEDSVKRSSSHKFIGLKKCSLPPSPIVKKSRYGSKKSHGKEVPCDADDDDRYADGENDSTLGCTHVEVARCNEDDQEECSARDCKKPAGTAIDWIQCDRCSKWYHQICLNLTPEEADADVYHCPLCTKKR